MKYNSINLIPSYVVEDIFEDIKLLIRFNNKDIIETIKLFAKDNETYSELATNLIAHIEKACLFDLVRKRNNTDLARLTWKKQTKMFVEPIEIKLEENDKFHYVPRI